MKTRLSRRLASLATGFAAAACSLLFPSAASAQDDRILDTPTGWVYYYGASGADVDAQIASGYRPFAVHRTNSGAYDTVFVSNTGAYQASGAVLRRAQTAAQMNSYVTTNNRRILDLASYDNGAGGILYDAVTISNTGDTAAPGWAYQVFNSWQEVVNWQAANPTLRPIDIDRFAFNGGYKYSIVAIPNTGNNAQSWGWYFGQTHAQVDALLAQGNGARLIDIDVEPTNVQSEPLFNVIFVGDNPGLGKWEHNLTAAQVTELLGNTGTRITVLQRYTAYAESRYAVAVVDNLPTSDGRRIRDLMLSQMPNSIFGYGRRRIGGSLEGALNAGYQFEPASCMKIVHGSYAITRLAAGIGSFATTAYCQDNCLANANDCPLNSSNCNAGQNSLDTLMYYMFHDSNNNMTKAIEDYYGRTNLNNWLAGLGLDIRINHTLGCGGPPANEMSCADVTRLYEMAFDGELFNSTWQNALRDHMIHGTALTDGYILQIINQEAASTNLTPFEIDSFKNTLEYAFKGGSYLYGGYYHKGNAGRVRVPHRSSLSGHSVTIFQDYAVAMFVNDTYSESQSDRVYSLFYETLREPIRNALQSWDAACSVPPTITQDPESQDVVAGDTATFTFSYNGTNIDRDFSWYYSANGYNGWYSISDLPGHRTGTDTATLTITNASSADAGYYQGFIGTPCGSDRSASAHFTVSGVCIAPFVIFQPTSQTVTSGEDAVFSTLVGGSSINRTYQWQRLSPSGIIWTSLTGVIGYSGATSNTLTVIDAVAADEGQFRCRITNGCGSANTNAASLTVQSGCVPPSIGRNAVSIHVIAGADAVLSVEASGSTAGRTYQWQRRSGPLNLWSAVLEGHGQTHGTATATLTLLAVNEADEGSYRCVVTNSCGSDSSASATITVDPACGTADYNNDGDTGTDADIQAFFACLGGNCCPACDSVDFNGDGDLGTDADIESFFRVLSGGAC